MIPLLRDSELVTVYIRTLTEPDENGDVIPVYTESGTARVSLYYVRSESKTESGVIPSSQPMAYSLRHDLSPGDVLALGTGSAYEVVSVDSYLGADTLTLTPKPYFKPQEAVA